MVLSWAKNITKHYSKADSRLIALECPWRILCHSQQSFATDLFETFPGLIVTVVTVGY